MRKVTKSEIVIVGGGITGLITAYFLAKSGESNIVVLEKNYLGSGSTFRCATGIRASFTTEEHIILQRESIKLWKELSDELGFFYRRDGYVWLFSDEKHLEAFSNFSKLHNKYGVPTRIVTPEEIKELVYGINVESLVGGLYDPLAGKADPFSTIYSLAEACREMNVKIQTGVYVSKIIVEDNEVKGVDTSKGRIDADIVFIAAGYGSKELLKTAGVDVPLENVPHHALITEKFKQTFKPLVIDWATSTYIVQTRAGGFLMGSEMEEHGYISLEPRIDFIPKAVKAAVKLFPWMKEINVLRYWTGYYVMSPDRHPILGPIYGIQGLYAAMGFSGHGFMMGPIVGKVMSEWILKSKPSIPQAERLTIKRVWEGKLIHEKAVFG